MQSSSARHPKCRLCRTDNRELRYLLKSLNRRLNQYIEARRNDSPPDARKIEGNAFKQLVRILFPSLLQKNDECDHAHISISLASQLAVSADLFAAACSQLAHSLAETNYQLELIATQIKNVTESIGERRVEHEDSSDEEGSGGRVWRRRGGRRGRRGARARQQQKYENSIEWSGMGNEQREVRSDASISPHSDLPLNHFGYYLSFPLLFPAPPHIQ